MFGGVGKAGWATILVAGGVMLGSSVSAQAADLGGDCCSDLEERVAELEATTARKGNRKVSLEVSGHINEAVMFWDDGAESNAYVVGNDSGRSRFRFKGKAKINSDLSAGYLLEIGVRTARSDRVNQNSDDPGQTLDIRHSVWNLTSKTFGGVHVGFSNSAMESITENNLSQTKDIAKNADTEDQAAGFLLRNSATGALSAGGGGNAAVDWADLVKGDFIQPGEGSRGDYIRYVSPEFNGLWVEVAYGEDDYWDAAVKWKGHEHGFKWVAGIGYGENTDTNVATMPCIYSPASGGAKCHQYGGSVALLHEKTGLFANVGAGQFVDENIQLGGFTGALNPNADDKHTFYSIQAGIEQKFNPLGKTTLYGEYFNHDGGANDQTVAAGDAVNPFAAGTARIWDSEVQVYGLGAIQGIDAAAMRLYAFWRHYEADVTMRQQGTGTLADVALDDLDIVMGGALIEF